MPDTGLVIAKSQSNDTLASTTWSNQANVLADSDTEVTEAIIAKNTPGTGSATTGWLKVGAFGLDAIIPAGVPITKVEIVVRWRMNSAAGVGNRDCCWAIGGTRGTNVHAQTTEPTVLETTTLDVTSERAWTAADFANATFAVHVRGRNGNNATDPSYRFAWVKVRVTWAVPQPIDQLVQTFAASIDTAVWTDKTADAVWDSSEGGRVRLPCTSAYAYISTGIEGGWVLTGSSVYAQIVPPPGGADSREMFMDVSRVGTQTDRCSMWVTWAAGNPYLMTMQKLGGSGTGGPTIAYDPVAHRCWRIRETGGTIYFETSPDGVTWTVIHSEAKKWSTDNVWLDFSCGYWGTEAAANGYVDNVNAPPTITAPAVAIVAVV